MSHNPARIRPPGRSLHLVDLDNLIGGPWNPELVPESMERYLTAASFRVGDHLVVAAEVTLAVTACFQMPPGTRFLVGRGPDGADRRLVGAATPEHIAARYERLVIGSGDHRFTDVALAVRRLGTAVTAIALQGSLSLELGFAADRVRLLAVPDTARAA